MKECEVDQWYVAYGCHHVVCYDCSSELQRRTSPNVKCPVCRNVVSSKTTYRVTMIESESNIATLEEYDPLNASVDIIQQQNDRLHEEWDEWFMSQSRFAYPSNLSPDLLQEYLSGSAFRALFEATYGGRAVLSGTASHDTTREFLTAVFAGPDPERVTKRIIDYLKNSQVPNDDTEVDYWYDISPRAETQIPVAQAPP